MCIHDGLNEECPGRNCPCPCDACVLGVDDGDEDERDEELQHELKEEDKQRRHEEMIAQDPDPFFGP